VLGFRDLLFIADDDSESDELWPRSDDELETDLTSDDPFSGIEGAAAPRDETWAAAARVLDEARRMVVSDYFGLESPDVRTMKNEYLEEAPQLRPLAERQLIADLSVAGGGRHDEFRRRLFRRREEALIVLFLLGYEEARIARGVGLSESQVRASPAIVELNAAIEVARNRMIRELFGEANRLNLVSAAEIGRRVGLPERQVQRVLDARRSEPRSRQALAFFSRIREQPRQVARFINTAVMHAAYPWLPGFEQRSFQFAGLPLHKPEAVYHTWFSDNENAKDSGAPPSPLPPQGEGRPDGGGTQAWLIPGLGGVLPPALAAMLNGEVANAPIGLERPTSAPAVDQVLTRS
jgi:hypothetical protein